MSRLLFKNSGLFITFLLFFSDSTFSQNFVVNHSFENFKCEKWYNSSIENCDSWSSPTLNSPDYFMNACPEYITSRFPDKKWWGPQLPFSGGNAYAGIIAYRPNYKEPEKTITEYLQGTLSEPLKQNIRYTFQLWISLSESSALSINNLGVYFSDKKTDIKKLNTLKFKPQIVLKIRNDTARWIGSTQTFTAAGNEKYFIIGCFDDGTPVKTGNVKPSKQIKHPRTEAYYFIDDVTIFKFELFDDENEFRSNPSPIKLYNDMFKQKTPFDSIKPSVTPTILKNVFFESGKSGLLENSFDELDNLYIFLVKNPGYNVQINGYTDNSGSMESNLRLSEDRARAVASYLRNKDIDPFRITSKGFGDKDPTDDNTTEKGRSTNRRVTFTLIQKN